jgi:hypothetical protein
MYQKYYYKYIKYKNKYTNLKNYINNQKAGGLLPFLTFDANVVSDKGFNDEVKKIKIGIVNQFRRSGNPKHIYINIENNEYEILIKDKKYLIELDNEKNIFFNEKDRTLELTKEAIQNLFKFEGNKILKILVHEKPCLVNFNKAMTSIPGSRKLVCDNDRGTIEFTFTNVLNVEYNYKN